MEHMAPMLVRAGWQVVTVPDGRRDKRRSGVELMRKLLAARAEQA
jgi:hypothetical protein